MKQKYPYLILLMLLVGMLCKAQDVKRAELEYSNYAFAEATKLYEKGLKQDKRKTKTALAHLGDTYYFNGKYIKALEPYDKMMKMQGTIAPIYYFRYSECLRAKAEYVNADAALLTYYQLIGKEDLIKDKLSTDYLEEIKQLEGNYVIKKTRINSPYSDFGAAFYGKDKIIFASARMEKGTSNRKMGWSDEGYTKLYTATIKTDGSLEKPVVLPGEVNSKYNQSSVAITKDGKTMYFTRNNYLKKKFGKSDSGFNHLKIYKATKINDEWTNIEDLPINGDNHSNGHPALSPDGKFLYYVSNQIGGLGDSDIYVAEIREDGRLKVPVNLGSQINTVGKETFPFVSESGILYFSSNGHLGRGGLDVFAAYKDVNTGNYFVYNLGSEINSNADDFAFIINEQNKKGYFTSNRGRAAQDDIYAFEEVVPVDTPFEIVAEHNVVNTDNGQKINEVTVTVFDSKDNQIDVAYTDEEGKVSIVLSELEKYKFQFDKKGYIRYEMITNIDKKGLTEFNITMKPEDPGTITVVYDGDKVTKISTGDDLMKKLKMAPIYFDYGGDKLRASSVKELNRLVDVMTQYPRISVEIQSHTDSRSSAEFNMKLSKRRAKTTVSYLIDAGISADRVQGEGYGKTRLLNHCATGVKCSEQEHQVNRRTEIIVEITP
ncbi:OmpA family protein [Flavobacterium sp. '19STA2R22 D10 B1']|uniref:OmpA family protein n=1 Tax=Flavobacterium aerium TaxID=3037261 RepID=UPI00278BB860|nr:OmpA family protein [Flavobacterium sp. '19STA2R22 D10 B1']